MTSSIDIDPLTPETVLWRSGDEGIMEAAAKAGHATLKEASS